MSNRNVLSSSLGDKGYMRRRKFEYPNELQTIVTPGRVDRLQRHQGWLSSPRWRW